MLRRTLLVLLSLSGGGTANAASAAQGSTAARPMLLIHIEKTGGDSVLETLGIDGYNATAACQGVNVMERKHAKHNIAAVAKGYYTEEEWANAYKMSFVRNPWARIVSGWAMVQPYMAPDFVPVDTGELPEPGDAYLLESAKACSTCTAGATRRAAAKALLPTHAGVSAQGYNEVDDAGVEQSYIACELVPYVTECITDMFTKNKTELDYFLSAEALAAGVTEVTKPDEQLLVDFVGRTENMGEHLAAALIDAGNDPAFATACAASLVADTHGSVHGYYTDYFYTQESIDVPWMAVDAAEFDYKFNQTEPMNVWYKRAQKHA